MPFANDSSGVACRLEECGKSWAVSLDERISLGTEKDKVLEATSEGVATGQKSIASCSATGGWGVSIGEENSKSGQAFHLRSGNLVFIGIAR